MSRRSHIAPLRGGTGKSAGFTLVEALVTTVIVGIAFTGVYSLTMLSRYHMQDSVARQKLQIQADQMLAVIESDLANIAQYNLNMANCVAPGVGVTTKSVVQPYEWCRRMNGEVGNAGANDTRSVQVTVLGDGRRVVHILLEALDGRVQIVMKRAYDG